MPEQVNQFSGKKKGTLIGTIPPAGTKLAEGAKIKLLVSAGFPQLAFDDGKNVLLANGANGKRLPAIAKGSQEETDPACSFDGTQDRLRERPPRVPQEPGQARRAPLSR